MRFPFKPYLLVSGTMGIWGSIPFEHGYDGTLDPYEDEPGRAEDELSVTSICKAVHEEQRILAKFLAVGNPRVNVIELKDLIKSEPWTKDAHMLLNDIWNCNAARWFCRAVESQEEQKQQDDQKDEVPWDMNMMVMECSMLIRSAWRSFLSSTPVCFVAVALPLNRQHGSVRY
jgi:hypothetical protein